MNVNTQSSELLIPSFFHHFLLLEKADAATSMNVAIKVISARYANCLRLTTPAIKLSCLLYIVLSTFP